MSDNEMPSIIPELARQKMQHGPLGLRPRHLVDSHELIIERRAEILLAMLRFSQANKHIPLDWILELNELNAPK